MARHILLALAMVSLLGAAACGEKKPVRVLVDVVQPDPDPTLA